MRTAGTSYFPFASFQAVPEVDRGPRRVNETHHRRVPEVGVLVVVGLE